MKKLNLTYYLGSDQYSDGDVESEILQIVKDYEPDQYDEIIKKDDRLPLFINLSQYRRNLLSWYTFPKDARVLEIGAGMGPFTRMLCEKCGHVTSLDMSLLRAQIIAERCRDKENLEIIVGRLEDVVFTEQYDYVIVIGVLEHVGRYTDSLLPYSEFLNRIKSLLTPCGKLLLAIENKLGLKYWCGEVEDHTGIPFESINHYSSARHVRTFDREELAMLLKDSNFLYQKFYYPLPDYKLPRVLYSDAYIPKSNIHSCILPLHYSQYFQVHSPLVADEQMLYETIIRNGVLPFFANSFLVECSGVDVAFDSADFVSITAERNSKYQHCLIKRGNVIEKVAASVDAVLHIEESYMNLKALEQRGLKVLPCILDGKKIVMQFEENETLEDKFLEKIKQRDIDALTTLVDAWYSQILQSSDPASAGENLLYSIKLGDKTDDLEFGPILKVLYTDMIFSNCFVRGTEYVLYDQEWAFHNLPANFAMYRALHVLYTAHSWADSFVPSAFFYDRYHLTPLLSIYEKLENWLFRHVQNEAICRQIGNLRHLPEGAIRDNVELLQTGKLRLEQMKAQRDAYERAIIQRETDIKTLEAALQQRDTDVKTLETGLQQCGTDVHALETALQQRETDVKSLEAALQQRDTDVKTLEAALQQRDTDVKTLEAALVKKNA